MDSLMPDSVDRTPDVAGQNTYFSTSPSASASISAKTSQGFYPDLEPAVLRRSLIISSISGMLGTVFLAVIQGTVFNFFLEDLNLRDRLPYFMGLASIAGLGSIVGSWMQERWNCRKGLFLWAIGGSRAIWLVIGLLPILKPEIKAHGQAFWWLSVLIVVFSFVHAMGANAWLSWMADLVPFNLQGKYWSYRQVACSGASIMARLICGYYLESRRHMMTAYAIVFIITAILGIIDALLFIFVAHRPPRRLPSKSNVSQKLFSTLKEVPLRRLCEVYLLWNIANCFMGPTLFYFMRDHLSMGVQDISLVETVSLLGYTAFSLLWGLFSDRHGHRGPLIICLIVQALAPLAYFFAERGDQALVAIAFAVGAIGFCGTNLFMIPMLINITKNKVLGRESGMAVFVIVMSIASFLAFNFGQTLYSSVGYWIGKSPQSRATYLYIMGLCMLLRAFAAMLVWLLPKTKHETDPGIVIVEVITTNPLRAAYSMVKYVAGQEKWEDAPDHPADAVQEQNLKKKGELR